MVEAFAPQTFVGNHDVTRIATRLTDRRHLPHALVVLLTVAGTPAVYYGDEQAMTGLKEERLGGDDAIRPAYPAAPADLPAEGWATYHLHQEPDRAAPAAPVAAPLPAPGAPPGQRACWPTSSPRARSGSWSS